MPSEPPKVVSLASVREADGGSAGHPGEAPGVSPERSGWSRRAGLLLVLLVIACAVLLAVEHQRRLGLEERVRGLETELGAARQEIEAYRGRLVDVRDRAADITARLEALQQVVEEGLDEGSAAAPSGEVPTP